METIMSENKTDLTEVKGIGPATAVKLHGAGIRTAEALASSQVDHLVSIVGRATARKIITNARELLEEKGVNVEQLQEEPVEIVTEEPEVESDDESSLRNVQGIGPKTQKDLIAAGFDTVDKLANADIKQLTKVEGVGKATAEKFIQSAKDVLGIEEEEEEELEAELDEIEDEDLHEEVEEVIEEEEIDEDFDEDILYEDGVRTEHRRSPTAQGIPTKKKRGVQIASEATKIDLDDLDTDVAEAKSGWQVKAKELTEEEREARQKRQEMLRAQERITRDIPEPPKPVKAKGAEKKAKGKKPEKKKKDKKKVKQAVKKTKAEKKAERHVDYYSNKDIHPIEIYGRPKVSGESSGKSQARIELDRDTYIGKITSKRRSRRNINNRQVIVKLDDGFNPSQLVGQKIYFTYPEGQKVSGSISKRFGKKSSGKVLVNFKKGVREEAVFQKIYKY